MKKLAQALVFASRAHAGVKQVRKYTGEPYINHPLEVLNWVATVPHTEAMLCAAVLHDTVEDTACTLDDVRAVFGEEVADLVGWLTDVSTPADGNRKVRKEKDRQHTAAAPAAAKTVKLADLISNSLSIAQHDPAFAKVYMAEKRALLEVLTEGDPALYSTAKRIVDGYYEGRTE